MPDDSSVDAVSSTAYALLGLLSVRDWSTYELAKQADRSLGWFWPRAERRLYDDAKRLDRLGLARSSTEPTGRRPRTVYAITPAGRTALARWLGTPSAPAKLESEALVRVFFADSGSLDDLRTTLRQVRDEAQERLGVLGVMRGVLDEPGYEFTGRRHLNALALQFQFDHHRAARDWARWALRQTQGWTSATDPAGWTWASTASAPGG